MLRIISFIFILIFALLLAPLSRAQNPRGSLRGTVQDVTGARVQPEQIKGISFFDNAGARSSTFIPKNVTQSGVEVRLANLNLTQIVDIGHALSNMGSSKMIGLDVKPGTVAGNYFDVIFKVVSFNIPAPAAPAAAGGRRGN